MHLHRHIDEVSYMGFWEVFKNLKNIYNLINECKDDILQFSPDLVLLVDYPGFNLRIAEFAHKNKITTYYYISPKIWAWKKSRINKIRKYVNRMFVIFPFEQEWFEKRNIPGEIFHDEWKDFGYNRTKALEHAYNKTDFLFIFDADDLIHGTIPFPEILDKEEYAMNFDGSAYSRRILISNRRKWKYVGVLHEILKRA